MAIHPLWELYPDIQKDLLETKKVMEKSVKIRNKAITEALHLFFEAGGKLLRPAYFLLFAQIGEIESPKKMHRMAASLEILHVATLIHDDIIDDSPTRRSLPSIQATFGQDIAVYTGDFLFTVYFHLLATSTKSFHTIEMNAYSMRRVLVGELDQMNLRYNTQITMKQYFQHIKGKTAQLFEFACFEGAYFGGLSKRHQLLAKRIGYNIGMAFQIIDDILDYQATEESFQKPVFEDLKNGYYTLPLILAMEGHHDEFAPLLNKKDALTDYDLRYAQSLILEYGGISRAEDIAKMFTARALSGIEKLPDSPQRKTLYQITETLLSRRN